MEVRSPMGTVHETLGCGCLKSNIDDELDRSLSGGTGISKKKGITVREYFRMEGLETLQGCENVMRINQGIAPSVEKIPWPLIVFYLNGSYIYCHIFLKIGLSKVKRFMAIKL